MGTHHLRRPEGSRVRRFAMVGLVVGLLLALAAPASAGQRHKVKETFADSIDETIPAGDVCDFPVGIKEDVKGHFTAWFDADDNLIKEKVHVNGTTEWTGPGGTAVEHWAWNGTFDPIAMTFTQAGNVWNVHMNGLVIHDKGLIVFDDVTGDVLKVAGPHEVFFEGLGALCDAIG